MIETAKSIARELGTSVSHIVKKKVVEDAKKALGFTNEIQTIAAIEVGEMLKTKMQVKREQRGSEAGSARGNLFNSSLSDPVDVDPPSPKLNTASFDDVPLSRVYTNLHKTLPPIAIHQTSTKV